MPIPMHTTQTGRRQKRLAIELDWPILPVSPQQAGRCGKAGCACNQAASLNGIYIVGQGSSEKSNNQDRQCEVVRNPDGVNPQFRRLC